MNWMDPTVGDTKSSEYLTFNERQTLERALAKIILLGDEAGVSIDEMILLLGSGLTITELVEYLAERRGDYC